MDRCHWSVARDNILKMSDCIRSLLLLYTAGDMEHDDVYVTMYFVAQTWYT